MLFFLKKVIFFVQNLHLQDGFYTFASVLMTTQLSYVRLSVQKKGTLTLAL